MRLWSKARASALVGLAIAAGCAPAGGPGAPVSVRLAPPAPAPPPGGPPPPAARAGGPALRLVLRPVRAPLPHVHVEIVAEGASVHELRLAVGAPEAIEGLAAEDERGPIAIALVAAPPGVVARLGRASEGALRVRYDVRASSDPHARPGEVVVAEDRFRGDGESLVLLPTSFEALGAELSVRVEGEAIEAPEAASSLGVGRTRVRQARAGGLKRSTFLAGSLGKASFHDGLDHDESAWLGYTAFDPRPAAAEVAQVRSALRELWQGGGEAEFGLYFVSTRRPPGSYALAGRASSLMVYLGPSEPWSAPLRVGIAQHLMRSWVGGELALRRAEGGGGAEAAWFNEGLARYLAARALGRLGLLTPGDVQAFVNGLFSVQALSPQRGRGLAEVAALAEADPGARAYLTARGALYAARVDAAIRAKSKGGRSLDDVVRGLLRKARAAPGTALAPDEWVAALVDELGPGERRAFDEQIASGREIALPPGALGKCFRPRAREYVTFALGFDALASFEAPDRVVVGLDPRGPAAAAGLRPGDVVDDASYRDGDPGEPASVRVVRGAQRTTLRYLPRGRRGRGPGFERAAGAADAACAPVL